MPRTLTIEQTAAMFGVDLDALDEPLVARRAAPAPAAAPVHPRAAAKAAADLSPVVTRLELALGHLRRVASRATSAALAAELNRAADHLDRADRILRSPLFRPRLHQRFAAFAAELASMPPPRKPGRRARVA